MKTASARLLSVSFLAVNAFSQAFAQHEEDHQTSSSAAVRLDTVVVTASPIQRTLFEQAQPVNILDGKELRLRLQPTIGDTLGQQAGISSSYFGPVSSRPVIRGLSDDRVQILSNGVTNLDLSNVSADHAVAVDPLTIDRIEVVRGPAALMYGPNSIGGVVNLIDSRIAEKPLEPNALGSPIRGAFDGRYNSVDSGGAGSGMVKFGLGPMVFHLDGFRRNSTDLRIPKETHTPSGKERSETESVSGRLPNSASQSDGGAAGASAVWDAGFFGLSYSGFNSTYGAVAERGVLIDLKQRRWDARGSFLAPANGIKAINYKFSSTDYQHLESGEDEFQRFKTSGTMGRVELVHEKIGLLEGAVGYQMQLSNMSVNSSDPAHALLPANKTKMHSIFIFEEIALEPLRYQFGARFDRATVESGARSVHPIIPDPSDPLNPLVGVIDDTSEDDVPAASREFNAFSLSGGVVYDLNKQYSLALNTGFTQRPPTAVELFARGPHHATGTFELGSSTLGMERALTFDLSFRKKTGRVTGSLSVFYNQFSRFISMVPTGRKIDDNDPATDPEPLPEYHFRSTRARLYGAEAEVVVHLLEPRLAEEKESPAADDSARRIIQGLHLDLRTDYVRAVDQNADRSLPRITPLRVQAALVHDWNGLQSRIETQHVARQNSLAENETRTASYTLLNASVSYQFKAGPSNLEFYVRGTNLTDRDARVHTSFLKDVAPLPARGVLVGLRADF
jgi:iron complex outermembrane receptor protein